VPGYGPPNLFILDQFQRPAPTVYPITYDQKQACNQVVWSSNLVDKRGTGKVRFVVAFLSHTTWNGQHKGL
jgi:hypothetical protein